MNIYNSSITIEVVLGGFVMTYPKKVAPKEGDAADTDFVAGHERWESVREVFPTQRKLMQRLKEVTEQISLVA